MSTPASGRNQTNARQKEDRNVTYRERIPIYDAVQWTGSNLDEVRTFVDSRRGGTATYAVNDGVLSITESWYFRLFADPNGYVVHGPVFGADASQAVLLTKTAAEFATQYEQLP